MTPQFVFIAFIEIARGAKFSVLFGLLVLLALVFGLHDKFTFLVLLAIFAYLGFCAIYDGYVRNMRLSERRKKDARDLN